MMKPPKLQTFRGQGGDDVQAFVPDARRILRNCGMDRGTAVEWILQALQGSARQEVLRCLDTLPTASAEDVLEVLLDTFSDRRGIANKLAHFFARRQSRTDTILDFALGMQAAAAVINEEQEGAVSEGVLTNTFVQGLREPTLRRELRRHIRQQMCSFLEARNEAMRLQVEDRTRYKPHHSRGRCRRARRNIGGGPTEKGAGAAQTTAGEPFRRHKTKEANNLLLLSQREHRQAECRKRRWDQHQQQPSAQQQQSSATAASKSQQEN
jgi:hypothetical protein